jgi:hypothetical protein
VKCRYTIFLARVGWYGFRKKRTEIRDDELLFLHLLGYVGHVAHFGVSGARHIDTLFFMLSWAQCGLHKKHGGTHDAELVFFASGVIYGSRSAIRCVRATKRRCTIFHAQVGQVRIRQIALWDTCHQTFVFVSIRICGSSSGFRCVRDTKRRHTIFHARVGPVCCP